MKLLSVFCPHITEELWEIAGNTNLLSTEVWDNWHLEYINEKLEKDFNYISKVVEDIYNIIRIVKSKSFDKIYLYTTPYWKETVTELIRKNGGNFEDILKELKANQDIMKNKEIIPFIKSQIKSGNWNTEITTQDEVKILMDFKDYVEKKVGYTIILNSEFDPKNKALKAMPFKPAIFIDI